jgi:hypothetical protein
VTASFMSQVNIQLKYDSKQNVENKKSCAWSKALHYVIKNVLISGDLEAFPSKMKKYKSFSFLI